MNNREFGLLLNSILQDLIDGKNKQALDKTSNAVQQFPELTTTNILHAWSNLENGNPAEAIELADICQEQDSFTPIIKLIRGIILSRTNLVDSSLESLNEAINTERTMLSLSLHYKARGLCLKNKYDEAISNLDFALSLAPRNADEIENTKEYIKIAKKLFTKSVKQDVAKLRSLIDFGIKAIRNKDAWFAVLLTKKIPANILPDELKNELKLLELESLFFLHQYKPAYEMAQKLKKVFTKNLRFENIYTTLKAKIDPDIEEKDTPTSPVLPKTTKKNLKAEAFFYENPLADVFSAKIYDVIEDKKKRRRNFYHTLNAQDATMIGVEVIFNNPFFDIEQKEFTCQAKWYFNDKEIGVNEFNLSVHVGWDAVIFSQVWGSDKPGYWKKGQGRVEIYIENYRIARVWYILADQHIEILEDDETEIDSKSKEEVAPKEDKKENEFDTEGLSVQIHKPKENASLDDLVGELQEFTGLESVKKSVKEFISFLNFLKEREKLGVKSDDNISINSVFLGNPGTGKTTVARLLGGIFKAMGLLEKGHVVEVDRTGLVGQYVGETAQKSEKVINLSMGGVLFIDEAYTLVKTGGSGQDFGQEAIDTLLKKMEDHRNEFVVIVAGYPDEMNTFLSSNPGMKSRFNHFFNFEDYTPDELIKIFNMMIQKDEYNITDSAASLLKKEFIDLYRKRDKTFGNARLVRQITESTKMQLSKRFLSLPESKRSKETVTTIIDDDIKAILEKDVKKEVALPINEEALKEAMDELNNLTGLRSVVNEMMDTVKLARYYIEQGENLQSRFSSHILFLGNPGTGKTTVARILGKIYSALGILPKGHLVETDRQGLVSGYVGQTAEKTTQKIDESIGGTLFIDEAYTLVKKDSNGDFGKEAIDTLLKRMEDDKGKFIVIAAGYTNEMKMFIESNPGMQSRFTKIFEFEDYTPDELLEITDMILNKRKFIIDNNTRENLMYYFNEIYRNRDKNFGNARIVRNMIDTAINNQTLRIASLKSEDRTDEMKQTITSDDFAELKKDISEAKRYEIKGDPRKLEKLIDDLHQLTGLNSVKESVSKMVKGLQIANLRKERGMRVIEKSLHAVFTGNPGTGKTTVARKMSQIYKELGLIEKGHLIEVDRADLVAGFQGQTALKTDEIIKKSLGGTLFIDEAYTLSRKGSEYGQEAIDTLLKRMEDYKGEFIVIVAGYPKEMQEFLSTNPGLESRFTNVFTFEDYEPRQLLEITNRIAESNGYFLDEGSLQLLLELFNDLYTNRDKNFGNARLARNILYKAIEHQENRIANLDSHADEDLTTIIMEDVELIYNEYQ